MSNHTRLAAFRLETLCKALDLWGRCEKALAQIHLSLYCLPPLETEEQAFRLFAADALLKAGLTPRRLIKALDLDPVPLGLLQKYNPDQPRVPAGNGRESGRWGSDGGAGANTPAPKVPLIGHGETLSGLPQERPLRQDSRSRRVSNSAISRTGRRLRLMAKRPFHSTIFR